jgi:hypothetical protein
MEPKTPAPAAFAATIEPRPWVDVKKPRDMDCDTWMRIASEGIQQLQELGARLVAEHNIAVVARNAPPQTPRPNAPKATEVYDAAVNESHLTKELDIARARIRVLEMQLKDAIGAVAARAKERDDLSMRHDKAINERDQAREQRDRLGESLKDAGEQVRYLYNAVNALPSLWDVDFYDKYGVMRSIGDRLAEAEERTSSRHMKLILHTIGEYYRRRTTHK